MANLTSHENEAELKVSSPNEKLPKDFVALRCVFRVESAFFSSRSTENICSTLRTLESCFPQACDLILSGYLTIISFSMKTREICQCNMRLRDAMSTE